VDAPEEGPSRGGTQRPTARERVEDLEREVSSLRDEVADLRAQFHAFRRQFE
jgi:hypothetical protein